MKKQRRKYAHTSNLLPLNRMRIKDWMTATHSMYRLTVPLSLASTARSHLKIQSRERYKQTSRIHSPHQTKTFKRYSKLRAATMTMVAPSLREIQKTGRKYFDRIACDRRRRLFWIVYGFSVTVCRSVRCIETRSVWERIVSFVARR